MPVPSPTEPVSQLRSVRIIECGEPLVDFLKLCPDLIWDSPRFHYRRETVLRQSVAERLCQANAALPEGYRLAIVEGWRPPHIQRRMYLSVWNRFKEMHPDWSDVTLRRVVNRFTAPQNSRVPPPHSTGAAIDLVLADTEGRLLDHISPYAHYDPKGFAFAAPGLLEVARKHRQILADALIPTGITNYPSEFWHWSYGDQGWAYRGGHPNALFAAITPANYHPEPADLTDAPLELIKPSDRGGSDSLSA